MSKSVKTDKRYFWNKLSLKFSQKLTGFLLQIPILNKNNFFSSNEHFNEKIP